MHPATKANNDKRPVLFLLHGRGRNCRSLIELPAIRQLMLDADIWIILPEGEEGWYMNSPVRPADRYADYLAEVLKTADVRYALTRDPARRAITGWSMGGYGAMRFAQTHADEFGLVATMIGLVDFPREENLPPGQNYQVPVSRFGADPAVWRAQNPINDVAALRGKAILLITAEDAFDRTMNANFSAALTSAGLAHEYRCLAGGHSLATVEVAVVLVLDFFRRNTYQPSINEPWKKHTTVNRPDHSSAGNGE